MLVFPDALETSVEVLCVGDGLYRLSKQPFPSATARYGDLIRAEAIDEEHLEFQEVVEPSHLMMATHLMSRALIATDEMKAVLEQIMATHGFWQQDLGGWLSIFFDADAYDPRPDIDRMCAVWNERNTDDFLEDA
jgi:hypothetical protein